MKVFVVPGVFVREKWVGEEVIYAFMRESLGVQGLAKVI